MMSKIEIFYSFLFVFCFYLSNLKKQCTIEMFFIEGMEKNVRKNL
ncbi:hypothetical protein HMPREF3037_02199 [Candidatus Stoquefichus sp. KLE1796]|nr:hypothetical protein HMPREF3037_02199 [Candidatus Stoquefichus sp. KLE1796]